MTARCNLTMAAPKWARASTSRLRRLLPMSCGIGVDQIRITAADTSKVPNAIGDGRIQRCGHEWQSRAESGGEDSQAPDGFAARHFGVSEAKSNFAITGSVSATETSVLQSSCSWPGRIACPCRRPVITERRRSIMTAHRSVADRSSTSPTVRRLPRWSSTR